MPQLQISIIIRFIAHSRISALYYNVSFSKKVFHIMFHKAFNETYFYQN